MKLRVFIYLCMMANLCAQVPGSFFITRIHYGGGGDWYSDPSSIPNLLAYIKRHTHITIDPIEKRAKIGDDLFHRSSYLYLTGHGNVKFSEKEAIMLRDHLLSGSFLHADDNYGLDKSFRREMKKVFPDKEWVELPPTHEIFSSHFILDKGLPKVHEHDKKRPQALGLFHDDKLIVLYTYESDLGDGWEDKGVHKNAEEIRTAALKMGTNIVVYSLSQ